MQLAWAVGSIMEALLALVVMTSIDHQPWRWLLGLSALPMLVVIVLFVVSIHIYVCTYVCISHKQLISTVYQLSMHIRDNFHVLPKVF